MAAGFLLAVLAIGLPAFLGSSPGSPVGGGAPGETPPVDRELEAPVPPAPEFVVDPEWFVATPADLELVTGHSIPEGDVEPIQGHSLRSNAMWCVFEGGGAVGGQAYEVPLDAPVTVESYIAACLNTDAVHGAAIDGFTVCRGVVLPSAYDDWLTGPERVLRAGVPGNGPGFPVVLGWESDCVSESLGMGVAVQLTDDLDLDYINSVRRFEIALVAASWNNCWTYEEAHLVAGEARSILGDGWTHVEDPDRAQYDTGCFHVLMDIDYAWVWVVDHRVVDPSDPDFDSSQLPAPTTTSTAPTGSG